MPNLDFLANLAPEAATVFWVLTGLVTTLGGVCSWLAIRYVTQKDDKDKVQDKTIETHETRIMLLAQMMNTTALSIQHELIGFKKANVEFQANITGEIADLLKQVNIIEATLDRSTEKADKLEEKLDEINEKMDRRLDAINDEVRQNSAALKRVTEKLKVVKQ